MTISRRDLIRTAASATVGVAGGLLTERVVHRQRGLGLTEITLQVQGWPDGLAGLTVGVLTDVHRSPWTSGDDVDAAVALLMQRRPSVILLGGDYVTWHDRSYAGPVAESLGALSAPHGVFAVLGNHDDERDVPAALESRGIVVLRDQRTRLVIRGEAFELAGIRFWTKRSGEIAAVIRGATAPVVLLSHDPRRLTEAAGLGIPLVVSGHTHGGQVVLPGLGAVAARKFPVLAGAARERQTALFVSRGLGTVYVPVRVNCPPEVALLTLQPARPV